MPIERSETSATPVARTAGASGSDNGQPEPALHDPSHPWRSGPLQITRALLEPPSPCPYLPGRQSRYLVFAAGVFPPEGYHELMNHRFRRSGVVFYRPECPGCRACTPVRVPTERFQPSRSQRRVWRRNADVHVEFGEPVCTQAKWRLYVRYLRYQHDGTMSERFADFREWLYRSCVRTVEFRYTLRGSLIGVGLADVCSRSLSTVYFYFDSSHARRSLGTYSILWEIEYCRQRGIPYYYLGYYVRQARTMNYKIRFRPCEWLAGDGTWRVLERGDEPPGDGLDANPIRC